MIDDKRRVPVVDVCVARHGQQREDIGVITGSRIA